MLLSRSEPQNPSSSKRLRLTMAEKRAKEKEEKKAMREKMEAEKQEDESREKAEAEQAQKDRDLEFAKGIQEEIYKEGMVREAAAAVAEVTSDPDSNPLLLPRDER